jgi:outer membrane protein
MKRVVVVCLALAGAVPVSAQNPASPAPPPAATAPAPRPAAPVTLKFGFVSSRQILQRTPGYAAAESTFNKEVQGFRDEVQKLSQQLDSATQAYDQASIALSPAAKQQRLDQLRQMQTRMQQRSDELQQRAQQREGELLQPIQARVNSIIQGLRAEGNYSFIFDTDAPGNPIIAADPALDLTAKVLQRLQSAQ